MARRRSRRSLRKARSKVKDGVLKETRVPGPHTYILAQVAYLDKCWDQDIQADG